MSTNDTDDSDLHRQARRLCRHVDSVRAELARLERAINRFDPDPDAEDDGTEQNTQGDRLASTVMNLEDVQAADREQLSPSEYVEREYDVDVSLRDARYELETVDDHDGPSVERCQHCERVSHPGRIDPFGVCPARDDRKADHDPETVAMS